MSVVFWAGVLFLASLISAAWNTRVTLPTQPQTERLTFQDKTTVGSNAQLLHPVLFTHLCWWCCSPRSCAWCGIWWPPTRATCPPRSKLLRWSRRPRWPIRRHLVMRQSPEGSRRSEWGPRWGARCLSQCRACWTFHMCISRHHWHQSPRWSGADGLLQKSAFRWPPRGCHPWSSSTWEEGCLRRCTAGRPFPPWWQFGPTVAVKMMVFLQRQVRLSAPWWSWVCAHETQHLSSNWT